MKDQPYIIATVVLLLLLCSTVNTVAQGRYRVSARKDYSYHDASATYRLTEVSLYGYDAGSLRGSTFNNDTINYNTYERYTPVGDSLVLKQKIQRNYNYDGRIDTIRTFAAGGDGLTLKSVEVFCYDRWGNVGAKHNYGPVSFIGTPRRVLDKKTNTYQYLPDVVDHGIQLAEKDSFVYQDGHKIAELSYCLFENCGFISQDQRTLPDTLSLKRRTNYNYTKNELESVTMLYPRLSRMYYPFSRKKMWYDQYGNATGYSTTAIDRKAKHIDMDSLHIAYNGDDVTETHYLYGADGDTVKTTNTVHYNQEGLMTSTRRLQKKYFAKNESMELTIYLYNNDGKLVESSYLRYIDKNDVQPVSNNIIRISYTPYGHVSEVYKEYNHEGTNGTRTAKQKTTYAYEAY